MGYLFLHLTSWQMLQSQRHSSHAVVSCVTFEMANGVTLWFFLHKRLRLTIRIFQKILQYTQQKIIQFCLLNVCQFLFPYPLLFTVLWAVIFIHPCTLYTYWQLSVKRNRIDPQYPGVGEGKRGWRRRTSANVENSSRPTLNLNS